MTEVGPQIKPVEKCEKNGFEHAIVRYYRILRGIEYHIGIPK